MFADLYKNGYGAKKLDKPFKDTTEHNYNTKKVLNLKKCQ